MVNKTVVLDGDCQLIIPQDGELGVVTAIRKPYPIYTGETTVTPSDSVQVLDTELTTLTKDITVKAIPGDYVGSDIPRRDSTDVTASGATVTAPAGYYEEAASKAVQSGTEGTPTATKGTVSNHSVSVTPAVTNTAGYISGGTKTGTPVTVTAEELESGTKSITENGTGIDVTGYAEVDVEVPSVEPVLQTISKTYSPSTSQQTEEVTASAGYDAIEKVNVTVNPMPTGTEGTPTASKGAVSNHSVAVTPSVTNAAGYIPGGTKTGTPVTVSASELDSGAKDITTNGTHDVVGYASASVEVPASEVDTGTKNITANGTGQDVVGYAAVDVNVPNSYTASDEGKVVSSGALVAQTSATYTDNGTYDTTLKDSVTVQVQGGGVIIEDEPDPAGGTVRTLTAEVFQKDTLSVTQNGTYNAPAGTLWDEVVANVSGGGGSSYTLLAQKDFTINNTGSTIIEEGTISAGATAWTKAKMILVRAIDSASLEKYNNLYVTDTFIYNSAVGTSGTTFTSPVTINTKHVGYSISIYRSSNPYGVYAASIDNTGEIAINSRYSSNVGNIQGTYTVSVYALDWPENVSPL